MVRPQRQAATERSLWSMVRACCPNRVGLILGGAGPLDPPGFRGKQTARPAVASYLEEEEDLGNTPVSEGRPILAQAVRELAAAVPWGHHVLLLGKIKSPPELFYYVRATARFGWSRNVLLNQIKAGAYERAVMVYVVRVEPGPLQELRFDANWQGESIFHPSVRYLFIPLTA